MSRSNTTSDESSARGDRIAFVHAQIGADTYALERGRVRTLVRGPALRQIPRTPPTIAGITAQGGSPTAVIDGRQLCTGTDTQTAPTDPVLVVFARTTGDQQAGLLVDAVTEIDSYPVTEVTPAASESSDRSTEPWYSARIEESIWVIDPSRLIEAIASETPNI